MRKTTICAILLAVAGLASINSQAGVRVIVNPWWPRAIVVAPPPPPPVVYSMPAPQPVLTARFGYIDVNVKPGDSDVIVDGHIRGKAYDLTRPHDYLALSAGQHSIVISRDGFKPSQFSVIITPDKTIELDVTLALLAKEKVVTEPPPTYSLELDRTGYLTLSVEPRDTVVYVDNNFYGTASQFTSPSASIVLRAGPHKVELSRPGFVTLSQTVQIANDRTTEIKVLLTKAN